MKNVTTQKTPPQGAALYIHWPFCKKKCPYCDFNSHVREGVDHRAWRDALINELRYWYRRSPDFRIMSIFFGGGTPSLMAPSTVAALIDEAGKLWGLDSDCEITLEANPTSVEAAKFTALASAGVNRVSLGVQSLRAESLTFLGREHSNVEALNAVALAAKTFPRYSFDLIYALPGQTLAGWEAELREALAHARGHLSLYQLTIEENTAFHHAYHVDKHFALPEDGLAADLYALTQTIMAEAGLPAYEVSNHASPGEESRHNLAYWRGECYFGIGPGAHGRVDFSDGSRRATRNLKSPERWLSNVIEGGLAPYASLTPAASGSRTALRTPTSGLEEELALTTAERAEEKILMGLRLNDGFVLSRLRDDEHDYLNQLWADGRVNGLVAQGMLVTEEQKLRATQAAMPVLNYVIGRLLG
jgi:putative oxygen-independent coproporphyrinogen III oxidase